MDEDIVGNAYQYMIGLFASDAGKKGGEFYTPAEVSELLARLVKPQENDRIYDPTCGSGSLLIGSGEKSTKPKSGDLRSGTERCNPFLGIDEHVSAWHR